MDYHTHHALSGRRALYDGPMGMYAVAARVYQDHIVFDVCGHPMVFSTTRGVSSMCPVGVMLRCHLFKRKGQVFVRAVEAPTMPAIDGEGQVIAYDSEGWGIGYAPPPTHTQRSREALLKTHVYDSLYDVFFEKPRQAQDPQPGHPVPLSEGEP